MKSISFASSSVVLLLLATVLFGQPVTSAQLAERALVLLNSSQWLDRTWGVYLAGRLHRDDLRQPLIEQFRFATSLRDSSPYTEEGAFLAALFDAAIEAGIAVPAALLEPFKEKWTDPVLILLARENDNEDMLLAMLGNQGRDVVWLTANNLLFERKSQRWYATTLEEVTLTHRFAVRDSDEGAGFGASQGGGVCGDGVAAMPKGFPPVTLYYLRNSGNRGNVLLARGPENVYYERTVVPTDKQVGSGSCMSLVDRMAIRIGYLAQLRVQSREETERLFHGETQIRYTTVDDFKRTVERRIDAQEQGIRAFVQTIEKAGLSARDVRLKIVPQIEDKRQKSGDQLPTLAPRAIDLR